VRNDRTLHPHRETKTMVDNTRKVNETFSIAGQVTPEQLQQAAAAGFQSVLNLRSPAEPGVLLDEQQQAETTGLQYANVPISNSEISEENVNAALTAIDQLPKPILVHCGAGARAGAIALIAAAKAEGLSLDQLLEKVQAIGIPPEQPHLQQFIAEHYSSTVAETNIPQR
jgi:uncharacterized protein (TIGR01244 family)